MRKNIEIVTSIADESGDSLRLVWKQVHVKPSVEDEHPKAGQSTRDMMCTTGNQIVQAPDPLGQVVQPTGYSDSPSDSSPGMTVPDLFQHVPSNEMDVLTEQNMADSVEAEGSQAPQWIAASLATAQTAMKGNWFAHSLRLWSRAYILDRENLPWDLYGDWKMLRVDNEDLVAELHLHLQLVGRYIKANDLVQYLSDPGWVHIDAGTEPQPKGEGESIMVSNFISPKYGWCSSPDGKEFTRVIFQAGKVRDGYYMSNDVLAQTSKTMDLLQKHYPDYDHTFIFDNASTHLKHGEDALSACHMPKRTQDWGVDVMVRDEAEKVVNGPNGKPMKTKV
ncbi:hypothetical protein BS17DRAFT_764319 [Gyrodon lividus]|nr:hypothetical protein BS17DRAFT_764319 [Gyrodon lividus]